MHNFFFNVNFNLECLNYAMYADEFNFVYKYNINI